MIDRAAVRRRDVLRGAGAAGLLLCDTPLFAGGPHLAAGSDFGEKFALCLGQAMAPLAANALALAEVQRLDARADALLRQIGMNDGTVPERLTACFGDQRYLYPDSDAGRDRAVADMNDTLARARPRVAAAFKGISLPHAEVRRMSPDDLAKGKAGYRDISISDAPSAYYVDLRNIRNRPRWTLPSVAFHELIPGHCLQLALPAAHRRALLPLRNAPAFFEAWGLYAEWLMCELGFYADDRLGELGFIHWRLFRMARVVVDIGLHTQGWSRGRAILEMRAIQGPDIAFTTIEADIDKMSANPAIYAAHAVGAIQLARMYVNGQKTGNTDFHPALLHGAILLDKPWPYWLMLDVVSHAP